MAKHGVAWMVLGVLLGGCALVGFDDVEADPGGGEHAHDGDSKHEKDAEGPTHTGRADAGELDGAVRDGSVVRPRDAATRDGGDRDAAPNPDSGEYCNTDPYCEGTEYVECDADGGLKRTECATGDSCRPGVCDSAVMGGCVVEDAEDNTSCDDEDACTTDDHCFAGRCKGTELDCGDHDRPCRLGVCDRDTGDCTEEPRNQDLSCGDGLTCDEGWCIAAAVLCGGDGDGCGDVTCSNGTGPCRLRCPENASCNFTCEEGTRCDFDCSGAGEGCGVLCLAGSECTVQCDDADDCGNVECAPDACELNCAAGECPAPGVPN